MTKTIHFCKLINSHLMKDNFNLSLTNHTLIILNVHFTLGVKTVIFTDKENLTLTVKWTEE